MRFTWPLLLGLIGAKGLFGQSTTIVLPAGAGVTGNLATREGSGSLHVPAYYAPSRLQTVYRGKDLKIGATGFLIASLGVRRDGLRTGTYRAHDYQLSVSMSSLGVELPVHSNGESFKANHGQDVSQVVSSQKISWPAEAKPITPPAPFTVTIKLDKPFLLLSGRNLCVDMASTTLSTLPERSYWYVDTDLFSRSAQRGKSRSFGRGCPFAFQVFARSPALDGETDLMSWSYTRFTGPSGAFAFLWIGASNSTWGTLPLPIDLTSFGAPGCKVYTGSVATVISRTIPSDPRGLARFRFGPIPKLAAFQGATLYQQALVADPKANALGLRFSNYNQVTLGQLAEPLPARMHYNSGSATSDQVKTSIDGGIVIQLKT